MAQTSFRTMDQLLRELIRRCEQKKKLWNKHHDNLVATYGHFFIETQWLYAPTKLPY